MKPSAGSVTLDGNNMTRLKGKELVRLRQKTVSFIFQEGNLLPHLNARDNVAEPLRNQGVRSKEALKKADEMLERLSMPHRARALPKMLSGGEQQRIGFARVFFDPLPHQNENLILHVPLQVAHPMHSTPRRNLQTPVRGQQ